jgi:serine/alanine adding enzyme
MMQIVRELDEGLWRDFVDNHPQGNIFHSPELYQVFQSTKMHNPELWAATGQAGNVLALFLPVQISMANHLPRSLTTRAVAYGSVLADCSPAGDAALAFLLDAYNRSVDRSVLFTELRNISDLGEKQGLLRESHFLYEDHLNYLIPLDRPPDEVFQNIGKRTRNHLRRELRKGVVTIEEISRKDQLPLSYNLLRQTYINAKVPLSDPSLFEAAFNILHPQGNIKFLLAKMEGEYVATAIHLLYKHTIYGWYGGLNRDYNYSYANELLTWHILNWGAQNGFRLFDFGGAGKPNQIYGVRDFKAKFGGTLVNFGRNICTHQPLRFKISQVGYQLLQKFFLIEVF